MTRGIIDSHAHLGAWPRFSLPDAGLSAVLRLMDLLGISHAMVAHHAALAGLLSEAEKLSLDVFDSSDGRIRSYLVFDPNRVSESMEIIERCRHEPFFAGIKLHPSFHNCPANDDRYCAAWQLADREKLVVLVHTWDRSPGNPVQDYSFPDLLEDRIKNSPGAKVILGHAGGRYNGFVASARLAATYPNVFIDLTGDGFVRGRVEYFVRAVSGARVLFGSDMPWIDPRFVLGELLAADITDADREAILSGNAEKLFGLEVR